MKAIALSMMSVICLILAGCETNRPQETPEVVEVDAAELAAAPAGSMEAWYVKVCPKKTDASWFRISIGPDDHNITQKIVWKQGDPLEFQLLHTRDFNQIYVVGYSGEDGKRAFFGVCHDNQVCSRHYEVSQTEQNGGEGHLIKSGDSDIWDCN
jgi:hypothetical protein